MLNLDIIPEDLVSVLVALVCGSLLGFEREYQNKSAGFRTIILICLGAAVFTLSSGYALGASQDRIAANIVTGIGFIGAGVIFKDSLWVKGLTTAAVIWVSAAIGVVSGMGHHLFALILSVIVVIVLSLFSLAELLIDRFHHKKQLNITFINTDLQNLHQLENIIKMRKIRARRMFVAKNNENNLWVVLELTGTKRTIKFLNEHMVNLPEIKSFSVM